MTDWRTDVTVRVTALSRRAKKAWDETTAAIRVLADGREVDNEAGDLYLGHLQSLVSKWKKTIGELRMAIDSNNSIMALQAVEVLEQVTVNTEGLAATVQARARKTKAPPGTTAETETVSVLEGEEPAGMPTWVLVFPFALVLLWVFGRSG